VHLANGSAIIDQLWPQQAVLNPFEIVPTSGCIQNYQKCKPLLKRKWQKKHSFKLKKRMN
jgi:hypothetical protein